MEVERCCRRKTYEELVKVLHIPHIEIFFDEYDAVYLFGKKLEEYDGISCIMERPEIGQDRLSELSGTLDGNILRKYRKETGNP